MRLNKLLKFLAILLFCGFTIPTNAQYEINSSVWMDEYTIQHHIDNYLGNLLLSYDYYQKWNNDAQQFESDLPARLTYPPFASKNIEVEAVELTMTQRSLLFKWENFDVHLIESFWKDSKKIYSTLLTYDDKGRLTSSVFKNFEYKPVGERIDYNIAYNQTDTLHEIMVEVCWSDGLLLKKKSTSLLHYYFNNQQRLVQANTSHQSERENSTFVNSYSYDTFGRLKSFLRVPPSEVYRDGNYTYTFTPFHLDSVQDEYDLLKIPSMQHWLRTYADSGLHIIAYQKFEPNRNAAVEYSYLVDSRQNRLLMLRPYPSYFGANNDSSGNMKSLCTISSSQDLNDTVPYDPNYEPRYIGTFYSQCSVEERYTTPPGLINAGSIEGYKRTEQNLPNGWKRITYQRGSSAPSRFAPSYPVSVGYDILYDLHLILDSQGVVRYIVDYTKLIKIGAVSN